MRPVIHPYKMGSQSARLLARALGAIRVYPSGRYTPRRGDFIVNWGASTNPTWMAPLRSILSLPGASQFLNEPSKVAIASNKLKTFRILQEKGVSVPEFTTSWDVASDWDETDDARVYVRHLLTSHSGAGIEVFDPEDALPPAPLYVKEIENHGEYRVHVVNGQVIDYIKKRRRDNDPATNEQLAVRNLANGWVYTRQNLRRLERVEQLALDAISALELDFGAVDIIMDENGDVFVLEVNTACGMSDTTLNSYVNAFNQMMNNPN